MPKKEQTLMDKALRDYEQLLRPLNTLKVDGWFESVPLDDGLTKVEWQNLVSKLPDEGQFIPASVYGNTKAAHGFVDNDYNEEPETLEKALTNLLVDVLNKHYMENEDHIYCSYNENEPCIRMDSLREPETFIIDTEETE